MKRISLVIASLLAVSALTFSLSRNLAFAGDDVPEDFKVKGDPDEGIFIYKQYCKKCHGKKGDGTGTMAADLVIKPANFTEVEKMSKVTDRELYIGVRDGGPAIGKSEKMTPWKDVLEEQEIYDVISYIKLFWADE